MYKVSTFFKLIFQWLKKLQMIDRYQSLGENIKEMVTARNLCHHEMCSFTIQVDDTHSRNYENCFTKHSDGDDNSFISVLCFRLHPWINDTWQSETEVTIPSHLCLDLSLHHPGHKESEAIQTETEARHHEDEEDIEWIGDQIQILRRTDGLLQHLYQDLSGESGCQVSLPCYSLNDRIMQLLGDYLL